MSFSEDPNPVDTKGLLETVVGWLRPGRESRERGNDRFVQFMFDEDRFLMDLPPAVLSAAEAEEISRRRSGFSLASDNPDSGLPGSVTGTFDPLQKSYTHGQEGEAAEDAAFVFFEVWRLPVNRSLYASAASVGTGHSWEQEEPFE